MTETPIVDAAPPTPLDEEAGLADAVSDLVAEPASTPDGDPVAVLPPEWLVCDRCHVAKPALLPIILHTGEVHVCDGCSMVTVRLGSLTF